MTNKTSTDTIAMCADKCMEKQRMNFVAMMEEILHESSCIDKYSNFHYSLGIDKNDNFRQQRKNLKVILDTFCFKDASCMLKIGNDYAFYYKHKSYLMNLLANFSSIEFKNFRKKSFLELDIEYILQTVDSFVDFISDYINNDNYRIYKQCLNNLYYMTDYYTLSEKRIQHDYDSFINDSIKGLISCKSCLCKKRITNLRENVCSGCAGSWDNIKHCCTLPSSSSSSDVYKDITLDALTCKHDGVNLYNTTLLTSSEKLTWLKYFHSKFVELKNEAIDVLREMDDIKMNQCIDNAIEETPPAEHPLSKEENLLILDSYLQSEISKDYQYKSLLEEMRSIQNKRPVNIVEELEKITKRINEYVKIKRRELLKEILGNDVESDEEVNQILSEIDKVRNDGVYNNTGFQTQSKKLLEEAITNIRG